MDRPPTFAAEHGGHIIYSLRTSVLEKLATEVADISPEALADPRRIVDAVRFLANQDERSATHELQLTPLAENWTP